MSWKMASNQELRSSITASTSVSISHSGSIKEETCMMVLAGRISLKKSPCTRAAASQSSIRVSMMRVRIMSPAPAVPTKNLIHVDFLDFNGGAPLA